MKNYPSPRKLISAITLLFLILFVVSCTFEDDLKVEPEPQATSTKKNPFTTENIDKPS